jgi:hypothetical protein
MALVIRGKSKCALCHEVIVADDDMWRHRISSASKDPLWGIPTHRFTAGVSGMGPSGTVCAAFNETVGQSYSATGNGISANDDGGVQIDP